ncbi:MAG TPA: hypothetical protein VJ972_00125 [Anaerolineales bacterium]|nr:hypothetical protein [Anaerolineales bacterium]
MSKVLVADRAGFIGSYVVDLFLEKGMEKPLAYFMEAEQAT